MAETVGIVKILIIGIHRSGTTSLAKGLHASLEGDFTLFREPYNSGTREYWGVCHLHPFSWPDSCIVKMLIDQLPYGFKGNYLDYFTSIVSDFDRVILLKRKNKKQVLESFSHANYYHETKGRFSWHSSYTYDQNVNTEKYKMYINDLYQQLGELQKTLNIKYTYYEDLYSGNRDKVNKFLKRNKLTVNLEEFFKFVDPSKKYRKE